MYSYNDPSFGSQLSYLLGELSHKANNSTTMVQALPLHLLAPTQTTDAIGVSLPSHRVAAAVGLSPTYQNTSSSPFLSQLDLSLRSRQEVDQSLTDLARVAACREQNAAAHEKNRMIQEYISLTLAINAIKEGTSTSSSESLAASTSDQDQQATVSERSQIALNQECKSPEQVFYTLNILGSTLRSKADPYIDASVYRDPGTQRAVRGGICELFPDKLYRMLCELEAEGRSDIVSFLPHGRAFLVHKMDIFLKDILPRYFSEQSKWSSFSRQLNLYGFLRVSSGPDAGAYYHELFLKGHPNLCHYMRRVGAPKGLDRRRYKLPEGKDPNFYTLSLKVEDTI